MFSIVILLFHSHSWIIEEDVVYLKNEYIFWIAHAKNIRIVKFYQSSSIIKKIMRPSSLQFSVVKSTLCKTRTEMTSLLSQLENSNLNNSRNNENFNLLFFCKYSSFLMVYPIQTKDRRLFICWTSPLSRTWGSSVFSSFMRKYIRHPDKKPPSVRKGIQKTKVSPQ